ncbi:uncharacterized protein [Coffea arabica]|uniref:Reverse transcriptase domain-containing protein n=1 Tax=Coffea arabica TaxID=13443 RepID=A0ABM4UQZ5_COFAR
MRKCFIRGYYHVDLHHKLQTLTQGSMIVEDYFKEMEMAMMRADVREDEEATMARFARGLRAEIGDVVELQHYLNMGELLDKAVKMERRLKRRGTTCQNPNFQSRNCRSSTIRSENTTSFAQNSSKPSGAMKPNASFPKPTPRDGFKANQEAPKPRNCDTKCFKCQGFGHIASQCPNQRVMLMMPKGEMLTDEEDEYEKMPYLVEDEEEEIEGFLSVVVAIAAISSSSGEGGRPTADPPDVGRSFAEVVASKAVGFNAKSFSSISSNATGPKVNAVVATHRGELFSRGRPVLEDLRRFFQAMDLKAQFSVGLLDRRHVLIRLSDEANYYRVWARGIWYIKALPMRVFKWSIDFHVDRERSIVPVWFSLPKLPVHLFQKECLFPIVSCLGRPLCVDAATAQGTRPTAARVCVEVDLLRELPTRVWIAFGDRIGFWQSLVAEHLLRYCGHCFHQGHGEAECRVKNPGLKANNPRIKVKQIYQKRRGGDTSGDGAGTIEAGQGTVVPPLAAGRDGGAETVGMIEQGPPLVALSAGHLVRQEEHLQEQDRQMISLMEGAGLCQPQGAAVAQQEQEKEAGCTVTDLGGQSNTQVHCRNATLQAQVPEYQDVGVMAEAICEKGCGAMANGSLVVEQPEQPEREGVVSSEPWQEWPSRAEAEFLEVQRRAGNLSPRGGSPRFRAQESMSQLDALNLDAVIHERNQEGDSHGSNSKLVVVVEPKTGVQNLTSLRLKLGMDWGMANQWGTVWLFYRAGFNCACIGESPQHLTVHIQSQMFPSPVILSGIHAKCTAQERQVLWADLLRDKPASAPWFLVGDFNVIISESEKRGGLPFRAREGVDFLQFMAEAGVSDVSFSGSRFTWCNNRPGTTRIWKRLDRLLVNGAALHLQHQVAVQHLGRDPSDHSPLLLSVVTRLDDKPRPFRFLNFWTMHKGFLDVVRACWTLPVSGPPMQVLALKLRGAKQALRQWSRQAFGDIFATVRGAEQEVMEAERRYDLDPTGMLRSELHQAQARLRYALSVEEDYWRQKARVKWLREGDNNTKFFHSVVAEKKRRAMIHRVRGVDGEWAEEEAQIGEAAVNFFQGLFSADGIQSPHHIMDHIPGLVSTQDNDMLSRIPSLEEVKGIVFSMDAESAAGPDGFTGKFFMVAWEVIAEDVYRAVVSFFCGAEIPRGIMATSMVLLPKVDSPQDFSQFRPISLCNFANKIISKLLAERLALILPKLISPQQSGFVKGRQIADNFLLAQELLTGIRKPNRGGNIVIKLDMMKAYDRVSWPFLLQVLRRFGFSETWIDMMWRLISNIWFSILVNGTPYGFFRSTRGLRQGDPISPALFVIGAEVLSSALNALVNQGHFIPFKVPLRCPAITHLAYADDVIIFSSGGRSSLARLKQVLDEYSRASGQRINSHKSCFLTHSGFPPRQAAAAGQVLGFQKRAFPVRYLGCPLYVGRRKKIYFADMYNAVASRILSWKNQLLLVGGRIVLVQSVLASMPIHLLAAASPSHGVMGALERLFADFLWGASDGGSKFHWLGWKDICRPQEEGGVGLRTLMGVHDSLSVKLWWKFRQQQSLWAEFMMGKYCVGQHPCFTDDSPLCSSTWKRMVAVQQVAEDNIGWVIRQGSMDFWHDNWMGSGALCGKVDVFLAHSVADFVDGGAWNVHMLRQYLDAGLVGQILQGRVPTMDKLARFGICGPSRCWCCQEPQEESLEHVFFSGEGARTLWRYFEIHPGEMAGVHTLRHMAGLWWLRKGSNEFLRFVFRIVPSVICWELWKARNRGVFEGQRLRGQDMETRVLQVLVEVCQARFPTLRCADASWEGLVREMSCRQERWSVRTVHWVMPQSGWKLNVDGCSRGNLGLSGGGGLVRDCNGEFVFGFSERFGLLTSLRAEMRALLVGIKHCIARGFLEIHLESDSLSLIRMVRGESVCPWEMQRDLDDLLQFKQHFRTVVHCYREANVPADRLANLGADFSDSQLFQSLLDLPQWIRGAIRLDQLGIPSIRRRMVGYV